jgi:hypothetical protein
VRQIDARRKRRLPRWPEFYSENSFSVPKKVADNPVQ